MCRSHAEHIYTPKRPVSPGNFSSFCCSLKPALTTALSGSLDAVPSGAEVDSAQHSVVAHLNFQLEKFLRREACESTNTTWVSNENATEQQAVHGLMLKFTLKKIHLEGLARISFINR